MLTAVARSSITEKVEKSWRSRKTIDWLPPVQKMSSSFEIVMSELM